MTSPQQQTTEPAVAAVQEAAAPLGLAWQMRVGTVFDPTNAAAVSVTLDGDQYGVVVQAASMVGQLIPGERVYVIQVPPAGQYIAGRMIGEERWLDAAVVDTTGTLVTTSAAVESDIPNLALTVPAWRAGHTYLVQAQIRMTFSVITDGFQVSLRRDTAVTGTQLAIANFTNASIITPYIAWPIRPSADEYGVRLFFSVVRTSGTGTCAVIGSPVADIIRTWSGIETANARTTRAGGVWRSS